MNMATMSVNAMINGTQSEAQSAAVDSSVSENSIANTQNSSSTGYLVSTEAALIAAIVVIVILLMVIICLLFRFLPTLYNPKPDPIIKSKRRRKRLKLKRRSKKSLSTSSYSVIQLKQNLDTPYNSNQSESRTVLITCTPKDDEDAPQTLLADQSSTESNLSLYNMAEPHAVTRDISLDVEPSERLQLQAVGSNLSTVSRSIRTNALSEGHHDRVDGHKGMDIVREDRPNSLKENAHNYAINRTDDGGNGNHGIIGGDVVTPNDVNDVHDDVLPNIVCGVARGVAGGIRGVVGHHGDDQDSDPVPHRVLPDIDDRRGDMVGMNQIGDDALDECSDIMPLRIVTNGD